VKRQKILRFYVGMAITGLTFYFVFRRLDWPQFCKTILSIDVQWVLPGIFLFIINLWVRSIRWKVLLRSIGLKKVPIKDVFAYIMVGYLANNIFPMRMGEFIRTYYVSRSEKIRMALILGTVAIEHAFDLLGLIFFALFLTMRMNIPSIIQTPLLISEIILILAFLSLVITFIFNFKLDNLRRIAQRIFPMKLVENIFNLIAAFADGLQSLRSRPIVIFVLFISLMSWILIFGDAYFYIKAFHFGLPFLAAIFVVTFTNLGTMIPSSPGAFGVAHFMLVVNLGVWGIEREQALGYAVVRHSILYALTSGIGLACLWIRHLSLKEIRKETLMDQSDQISSE